MRLHIITVTLALALTPIGALSHPHIVNVTEGTETSREALLDDLRSVQVVFIGELHDNIGHHTAQLSIIRELKNDEAPLAVGLEMFRADSQDALDRWVANEITRAEFMPIYLDNWSMWSEYREIFDFARNSKTKLIGLNIPRALTAEVARNGFRSLTEEERQYLGNVQCVVSPTYGDYIRKALGGYGGHGNQYLHFCEAQLLWDTMMSRHLVDFIKENPSARVVVLAGSGHAWKFGIPRQMLDQADISYRVILPETFSRVDRLNVTPDIADYLWMDVGPDGWSFN